MEPAEIIRHWVEEKLKEPDYRQYFVLQVQVLPANKVQIFLDGDQGIGLDVCRTISRFVEERLDLEGLIGLSYGLEVSSPGASRPLSLPRQYPKHVGRTLKVTLEDGTEKEGRLASADSDGIGLEITSGRGRQKQTVREDIAFGEIRQAIVKIAFK